MQVRRQIPDYYPHLNEHIEACICYQPRVQFLQASKPSKQTIQHRNDLNSTAAMPKPTSPRLSRCSAIRNGSTSEAAVSARSPSMCPWAAQIRSSSGGCSARAPRGRSTADAESVVDPDLEPKSKPSYYGTGSKRAKKIRGEVHGIGEGRGARTGGGGRRGGASSRPWGPGRGTRRRGARRLASGAEEQALALGRREEEAGTDRPNDSRHSREVARGRGDLSRLHGTRHRRRRHGGRGSDGQGGRTRIP
jgi:hypothetical protein